MPYRKRKIKSTELIFTKRYLRPLIYICRKEWGKIVEVHIINKDLRESGKSENLYTTENKHVWNKLVRLIRPNISFGCDYIIDILYVNSKNFHFEQKKWLLVSNFSLISTHTHYFKVVVYNFSSIELWETGRESLRKSYILK